MTASTLAGETLGKMAKSDILPSAPSPRLAAAAASTRTEAEVRAQRAAQARRMSIGRCYLYEIRGDDGTYFTESDFLPRGKDLSEADALAGAYQHDDLVAVWELNPSEGGMRDISEDIAIAMLARSEALDEYGLSRFVTEHLSDDDIAEHFADLAAQRDYECELASPEAMGRI